MKTLHTIIAFVILNFTAIPSNASVSPTPSPPLDLKLLRGGEVVAPPIINHDYVYVATGRLLTTWNYANSRRPIRWITAQPADGVINCMIKRGQHLYASWSNIGNSDTQSGIAVYSLENPKHPRLIYQGTYDASATKEALGLAFSNSHLYLFDRWNGIFVSDLANPTKPKFSQASGTPLDHYNKFTVFGHYIQAAGDVQTAYGPPTSRIITTYDVSAPLAPQKIASHEIDTSENYAFDLHRNQVIGVGQRLSLYRQDLPSKLIPLSSIKIPRANNGVKLGNYFYSYGYNDGLDVWNIANPNRPTRENHLRVNLLYGTQPASKDNLLLIPTGKDLLQAIDVTTPDNPVHVSRSWLQGGARTPEMFMHQGYALSLQYHYGLTWNDPETLKPIHRFNFKLPEPFEDSLIELTGLFVRDDTAYISYYASAPEQGEVGIAVVDIANPERAKIISRLQYYIPVSFAIKDNFLYVAAKEYGKLSTFDVTDPKNLALVHDDPIGNEPTRVKVVGKYAYMSELVGDGLYTGGLRIFDLSNPAAPAEAAYFNRSCDFATDLDIDAARKLLYLDCVQRVQIIDIRQPEAPVIVGIYQKQPAQWLPHKLAVRGSRLWVTTDSGLDEVDVGNPATPRLLKTTYFGSTTVPQRVYPTVNGSVYVLTGAGGVMLMQPPK